MRGRDAQSTTRTIALYAGFALTGVATTMLGPLLPGLIAAWTIDDARAGALFTAQFAGSLVGLAIASAIVRRLGAARMLVAGFTIVGCGALVVAFAPWPAAAAGVFCYGTGLSLAIPTVNLLVAAENPDRRAEALNILNFVWGAGALSSSVLVETLGRAGVAAPLVGVAVACGAVAVAIATARGAPPVREAVPAAPRAAISGLPVLTLVCAMAFLYVGTENAVSGWIVAYTERYAGGPAWAGTIAFAVFWAALLVGRAAAPVALRGVAAGRLVFGAIVIATAGVALIPATISWGVVAGAAALTGLGCAVIFPTTIAFFTEYFGERGDRIANLVFASAALGGATLPPCVGAVSGATDDLRRGLLVPVGACLAMLLVQAALLALAKQNPGDPHPHG